MSLLILGAVSSLKDKARSVRTINGMSAEEAAKVGICDVDRFDYFRLGIGKAKLARRPVVLTGVKRFRAPGNAPNWYTPGDLVGVTAAMAIRRRMPTRFRLTSLMKSRLAFEPVSLKKTNKPPTGPVGYVFAKVLGLTAQAEKKRIVGMMAALVHSRNSGS